MKKIYSLFILSILALTMFVGCQMPTDGTVNEYTITIVAPHGTVELDKTKAKAGETVKILKYTAEKGYRIKSANAYKEDDTLLETNPDHLSFVMPNCNVKIVVEYEVISNDDNNNDDDTQIETPTEGEDDTGDGEETEDPVDNTPTVDTDEATYGFIKTVNYTVAANGQSLPETKTGAELIAIAKEKNLIKDTDYTIDGTTVTLTASGVGKYLGYSLSVNASDGYAITGGGMKEAGKTVTLPITHRDVDTGWGTPTGLYLVKVSIREGNTDLDIPVTVTKDHKIQFTMPEKNINVFAQFCDIRYQTESVDGYKAKVNNKCGNAVMVVLCFKSKVYDNLKDVLLDGEDYYVLEVGNLESKGSMCFTETKYGDYELRKTGTLDDDHYMLGVIDNGELKILESTLRFFDYNPNAGLQSN